MTTTYGRTGSLTRDGETNVITFTRRLPASPERVWTALTTADGITSWLAPTATIDARTGGTISLTFDEENHVEGTITEFEPPSRLRHSWVINGDAESVVTYELEPDGGGTLLTLVHTGLPDEMCGGYTPGWHAYLARLEAVAEGESPPDWLEVFEAVAGEYA